MTKLFASIACIGFLTVSVTLTGYSQCLVPAGLSNYPPLTSSAATFNWTAVSGANGYQLRYWENANPAEKTTVDNFGPPPFSLRGLKKNTIYKVEIRSKCGSSFSNWSAPIQVTTSNSSGSCGLPTGVTATVSGNNVVMAWTSTGIYAVRYRQVGEVDWFVPAGAMNIVGSSFTLSQLPGGSYEIEVKRNCSGTASLPVRRTVQIGNTCPVPSAPAVIPDIYQASVILPAMPPGVTGFFVAFRAGLTGQWNESGPFAGGVNHVLGSPLTPSTTYQARIRAACTNGLSDYSTPTTFSTLPEPVQSCLTDKNAGKNMSAAQLAAVKAAYNVPSPFTFSDMIGINDGGLIFRSFQQSASNQITQLTKHFRNFHTMDEDFDASLVNYDLNIKPKNTTPEGTPSNMGYNKSLYQLYRNTHGFNGITASTEILQYAPQTWKDKFYRENDWSVQGPAGIRNSFKNYTRAFIQHFAPAGGTPQQILAGNFQVGNELWDYPVKADYHNLLLGARDAFIEQYGQKSQGGWKMDLIVGAFQAYRDNNCPSALRNVSNCDGDLRRHDHIGEYLDLPSDQCALLKDIGAIDCHPYSFKTGTTTFTFPEDPDSETRQIASLAAWLHANRNNATGILANTHLWSSEFGFDSHTLGEKTQAAYLLRGLFLHSRFHFEKVFIYNAFDATFPNGPGYDGLYGSSGLWRQGMAGGWPSPLEQNNATPKPAWHALMDLKNRFGQHVFYSVLADNQDIMAILLAKPDGSEPYLVFWSPKATNDANANQNIPVSQPINWQQVLPAGYQAAGNTAQMLAESPQAGGTFDAFAGMQCGSLTVQTLRRYPAFVKLISCTSNCQNITQPGTILSPSPGSGQAPFDPAIIQNQSGASGGDVSQPIVYQWQSSTDLVQFFDVPGANSTTFDPPSLTQTTHYRRGARRTNCPDFVYTAPVSLSVTPVNVCPVIDRFERKAHFMGNCNPQGDFYYEIQVGSINADVSIQLEQLPANGINIPMSLLNGAAFTTSSFHSNVQYIDNQTYRWQVKASNGAVQTLRLYYCWTNQYPQPTSQTTATNFCDNQTISCADALTDPGADERNGQAVQTQFKVWPNPGTDWLRLGWSGQPHNATMLRIWSNTGHLVYNLEHGQAELTNETAINTTEWPSGMYHVALWTGQEWLRMHWVKQ